MIRMIMGEIKEKEIILRDLEMVNLNLMQIEIMMEVAENVSNAIKKVTFFVIAHFKIKGRTILEEVMN